MSIVQIVNVHWGVLYTLRISCCRSWQFSCIAYVTVSIWDNWYVIIQRINNFNIATYTRNVVILLHSHTLFTSAQRYKKNQQNKQAQRRKHEDIHIIQVLVACYCWVLAAVAACNRLFPNAVVMNSFILGEELFMRPQRNCVCVHRYSDVLTEMFIIVYKGGWVGWWK